MSNPFDQFDRAPSGQASANPFDAFDHLEGQQAAFRAQHGADVPLPAALTGVVTPSGGPSVGDVLVNQSAGAGNALGGSLVRTANVLPFIAAGLSNLLGDDDNAARNFGVFDQGKAQAEALGRTAMAASKPAAVAGELLGLAPKLAAPMTLALDPAAHGSDLATSALQQNHDLSTAYGLGGLGTAASAAGLALPVSVPGNLLVRALTGGALNAGMSYGEQAGEHAIAPDVVAAPTTESTLTAGGIGALLAAALGHGAAVRTPDARLEADPEFAGLAEPQGQTRRPAGAANPGPVSVDAAGAAYTRPQGANAFAQAVQAGTAPRAPGLTEPVVTVDPAGNAATTADRNAALQPQPAPAPDPLGLTERLRQMIATDPRSAREGAPIPPKALPAPAIEVSRTGEARTTADRNALLAQQQATAAEKAALGLTPDIERSQGVRWAKQRQATETEAERQARLKELDDAIAAREKQNLPARGRTAQPDESVDDALTFLAKSGGLDRRTFVKEGLDPAIARAPENRTRGGASRPLFRAQGNGGMSLDDAARTLWQHGYLDSQDNNAALDLILSGVNQGEPRYSIHRNPQDDLLQLHQARQDADQHTVDTYDDVPFSRKPTDDASGDLFGASAVRDHEPKPTGEIAVYHEHGDAIARDVADVARRNAVKRRAAVAAGKRPNTRLDLSPIATRYGISGAGGSILDRLATEATFASMGGDPYMPTRDALRRMVTERQQRDPAFSFAGERSRTADRGALEQAKAMEAMGRDSVPDRYGNQPGSPEDTHIATGWHRGVDGKWRFEIDDSAAALDPARLDPSQARRDKLSALLADRSAAFKAGDAARVADVSARIKAVAAERPKVSTGVTVGDVLHHQALFEAYPDLAKVPVRVDPSMKSLGSYTGREVIIRSPSSYPASGDTSLKSVLLHEIQHAIQDHEGFSRGGSSKEARTLPEFEQVVRQQMAERGGELPDWNEVKPTKPDEIKAAQAVYRRLAGEVEARNTQRRLPMDAKQRREVPPSETADVPRSQQIVRFNADRAMREEPAHAEDAAAVARYNARLSDYLGAPVHFTPAAHVPDAAHRALAAFDDAFGGRTIVIRNDTPETLDLNGVTLRDGVRLVNEDATSPLLTVAGHEMLHQLRKDAPDLYRELVDEVRRQGRLDSYEAVLTERAKASGEKDKTFRRDEVEEELIADATGDALSDPDFLERLAKQNPGLFRRLADRMREFFDSLVQRLRRSLGSSPFLEDVEAFRDKLADVLDRYAQRQQGERGAAESAPEHALSRKPVDDQTQTPEFRRLARELPESVVDGLDRHAHALTDFLQSPSFGSKAFGLSDIPASVVGHVVGVVENPKVLRAVVRALPVDVVDFLVGKKITPEHLLRDKPMLKNVLSINGQTPVSLDVDKAVSLVRVVARTAAELSRLARGSFEGNAALGTNAGDSILSAHGADDVTKTKAFSNWFGDSKVVDAEGRPLVVYHATSAPKFDVFDRAFASNAQGAKLGHFFTTDQAFAERYANGGNGRRYEQVYLAIKNPVTITDLSRYQRAEQMASQLAEWRAAGHDGAMVKGSDGETTWIAFRPEQIKSATGNRGTFDPNEPSILFSRKPADREASQLPASEPALPRFNRATELWQERVGAPVFKAIGTATKALVANDLLKRHGLNLAEDMPAAARDAWRQYRIDIGKAQKAAHDIAKGAGHFTPAERALVSDYIEREMAAGVVPPAHVVKTAQMMTAALTHQSAELVKLGMLSPAAKERWEGRYLPRFYEKHVLANPFDKALRAVFVQGIKGNHLRGRGLFEQVAVKDVPKYQALGWELRGKDGKPVSLANRKPTDSVQMWRDFTATERAKMGEVRDGLYRFARGYTDTQRDIALGRLFARIADTVAREDNPGGWVQVPDTTVPDTGVKRFGKLAGKWVPGDVLAELKAKTGPSSELAKLYLKALSLWKEGKTSLNPVSHVNNMVSNVIMADLAGLNVADPRTYGAYAAAFKHYKTRSPVYQEAQEAGLFGGEWFGNEIHQYLPIPGELKAAANTGEGAAAFVRKALGLVGRGREAMGRAYQAEDAFFKFLLYLQARSRGVGPDDAVDWAQRWVFDYSTAAPGVRKLKNTVIPFANYGAKAIPALAFAATHYPWRIAKWMALLGGFALYSFQSVYGDKRKEGQAMEGELLPDYLKGGSAFFGVPKALRLPWNDDTGAAQYVDISRFLPMGDLFDTDNQMGGVSLPAPFMPSNPLLTTAYAMLANKDSFTGREVTRDTDTAGEAAAKRLGWLYRQMAPNNPLVPGTYNFNRLANAAAAASGHQLGPYTGTDYEGVTMSPGRAAAQTFGIKLRSVDLENEQERRIRSLAFEIRELRGEARQLMRNGTMPADAKAKRLEAIRAKIAARSDEIARLRALPVPEARDGR